MTASSDRLKKHIKILAKKIGERNIRRYKELEASADYIEKAFKDLGYKVGLQAFKVGGATIKNIEAEFMGSSRSGEIVLVGAHYDSVTGSPGANDNASGVAAIAVNVAFDIPANSGVDADHPLAEGDIGLQGVPVSCIQDMENVLEGIPLDKVSVNLSTIGVTMLMAFYLVAQEGRVLISRKEPILLLARSESHGHRYQSSHAGAGPKAG